MMPAQDDPPADDDGRPAPPIRGAAPRDAARLREIADLLGAPVSKLYGARAKPGPGAADAEEQERRLIEAFRHITDPAAREQVVELVEALGAADRP